MDFFTVLSNGLYFIFLCKTTIGTVEHNINGMLQYQSFSRGREARDYALLIDNNSYVQKWSLAQIVIILVTCTIQVICICKLNYYNLIIKCILFQVYFVRKLFDIKTGSSGSRSRI